MKKLLLTTLILAIAIPTLAQDAAIMLSADTHLKKGEYEQASADYAKLLEDIDNFKDKYTRKVILNYTLSVANWMSLVHPDKMDKTIELLKPYEYLKNYDSYPNKGKVTDEEYNYVVNIYSKQLELEALSQIEASSTVSTNGYNKAIELMNIATTLDPNGYLYYDLRSQAYYGLGKFTNTINDSKKAIELYRVSTNKPVDLLVMFNHYRVALIYRSNDNVEGFDNGLMYIKDGLEMLDAEFNKLSDSAQTVKQATYNNIKANLTNLQLDIYLNHPGKKTEAVAAFKQAIESSPNNYIIRIGYASLLEENNIDEAIKQYKQAIEIDSSQVTAYYNLASIFISKAADASMKANDASTDEEYNKYNKLVTQHYKAAYPYLVKAQQLSPNDTEILKQLISAALFLNLTEAAADYKKRLESLK